MKQSTQIPNRILQFFSPNHSGTLQARFTDPILCQKIGYILAVIGVSFKTQIVYHRINGPKYQVTLLTND